VIEQPEIVGLDRDRLHLALLVEPGPHAERHLDVVIRAVHLDVVPHDHLITLVEERDPRMVRLQHPTQADDATAHLREAPVGAASHDDPGSSMTTSGRIDPSMASKSRRMNAPMFAMN
jgi:hypothetical protein